MDVRIEPRPLAGTVTPPPSKSMAHRLIIAAALSGGVSTLQNVAFSQDIQATLRCMEALGARWERPAEDTVRIDGIGAAPASFSELPRFDCGESGSTLRFLIPIALAVAGGGVFTGRGRLMERPQAPYFDLFNEKGILYEQKGGVLAIQGHLTPGEYRLPGNVSSQFFTGLLFALPLLDGPSTVVSTTALESADYITMTLEAMKNAGIPAAASGAAFAVPPAAYRAFDSTVEADWSQAGFWYAANFLNSRLDIRGLNPQSTQGDMIVSALYWKLAKPGDLEIDVSGCPDLLPPLAVMAAIRSGATHFVNAARLRIKESDRLTTVRQMLAAVGGQAEEGPDSLSVYGASYLSGGTVDGANDHRIVMAAAIAATRSTAPVTILGAQAVNKSYPSFWDDYKRLGGAVHVL